MPIYFRMTRRTASGRSVMRLLSAALVLALLAAASPPTLAEGRNRSLVIVVDGLRPDYITADLMPNLYELGRRGVIGESHSAVYPTVTRVNNPSLITGAYPGHHGIMHNTLYVPSFRSQPFSTADAERLLEFEEFNGGTLMTAVTLGELLGQGGRRVLVTGSNGTGASLLLNHRGTGAVTWNARGFFRPAEEREKAEGAIGPPPDSLAEQTAWAIDAYLHHALSENPPDVTLMWVNDMDSAGHSTGVGSPRTRAAARHVDEHIGRIMKTHAEHGLEERVNIFVSSDHGFSTRRGGFHIGRLLDQHGLGEDVNLVAGHMLFLERDDPAYEREIVELLQRTWWVNNIYTRAAQPGSYAGRVPGTISLDAIQWNHKHSADILVSAAWSSDVNEYGYRGTNTRYGTAGHGQDSPWDIHIRLVAAGPDIKPGVRSSVPTGNVDIAPTVLYLQGLDVPESMQGRVMHELLRDGPDPGEVLVQQDVYRSAVTFQDGWRYEASIEVHRVGTTPYLRQGLARHSMNRPYHE